MKSRTHGSTVPAAIVLLIALLSCNLPGGISSPQKTVSPQQNFTQPVPPGSQAANVGAASPNPATPTPTTAVSHAMTPGEPGSGKPVIDVTSQDTASEKRAPYGDSYDINRFERPFLQDMTYVPDLDIASFTVSSDADWWYVSIELVGNNPNNPLSINYGVELDTNHDGFGDFLVWGHPPYPTSWDTAPVQIFQDTNHDTGGLSAEKSDAPMASTTNGYDTQIFNGGVGDSDPDLAWIRIIPGAQASVQFAFKKSWSGNVFMLGVISDAGLRDPKKMDYVDRFTAAEAGSPVRDNKNYPLKALYAVDNVCRAAFGFHVTGDEPQLCPNLEPPATKRPHTPAAATTQAPPQVYCLSAGTMIDTPRGPLPVESLQVGDIVWTSDMAGRRLSAPILKVVRRPIPADHPFVHLVLRDGRELWASPGHPTADGRTVGQLHRGDLFDGSVVSTADTVTLDQPATYDLLPAGSTGYYWANGILLGSTLK